MKKIKKADLKKFVDTCNNLLLSNGFVEIPKSQSYRPYQFAKITRYGTFVVSPDKLSGYCYSVFGCFSDRTLRPDTKEFLKRYNGNAFSGKCNIHEYNSEQALSALENLLYSLERP
jgi:hypothetical protein